MTEVETKFKFDYSENPTYTLYFRLPCKYHRNYVVCRADIEKQVYSCDNFSEAEYVCEKWNNKVLYGKD